jgi:hypothetical protein
MSLVTSNAPGNLIAISTNNNVHFSSLLSRSDLNLLGAQLRRWDTETITVTEEKDTLAFTSSVLRWLNPLAPSGGSPHALDEAKGTTACVGSVVLAHDWLDGLAGLIGVVEGDDTDVVV